MVQATVNSFDDGDELRVRLPAMTFAAEDDGARRGDAAPDRVEGQSMRERQPWTVREALEQCQAALPDWSFAEGYGVSPALIHQIEATVSRKSADPALTGYDFGLLVAARRALPAAWAKHGGVPTELASRLDAAIKVEAEHQADAVVSLAAAAGLSLERNAVVGALCSPSADGVVTGRVVAADDRLGIVVQSLGRGEGTVHRWGNGAQLPKIGEVWSIQVKDGRASLPPTEVSMAKGRER